MDHEKIDQRSLMMHWLIAERLRADPSLIAVARDNLERWISMSESGSATERNCLEWRALLDSWSLDQLCAFMETDGEEPRRFRQNSPFAGVLDSREVWKIKKDFAHEAA